MKIPRGKHYFKFIVDKVWKSSHLYDQVQDENGNINNFIDLSQVKGETGSSIA